MAWSRTSARSAATFTIAFAINDKSVVTGQAHFPAGNAHAFVYDGTLRDIGTLGGAASYAADINNRGVVVGRSLDAAGNTRPFIWDDRGGMRPLFDATGFGYATRINDTAWSWATSTTARSNTTAAS
jgi:probable HAF family extracellular repeat protein